MNMLDRFFSKIGFINLYTPNKVAMIRFYRDVLHMAPLEEQEEEKASWYGFDTKPTTFAIEPESNREHLRGKGVDIRTNVLMQFLVDSEEDLEQANQYLEAQGVPLITRSQKTPYGTFSNFLDPDKNLIELLVKPQN